MARNGGSIWGYLNTCGHYPDAQLDAEGNVRDVWLFEFKIHDEPLLVPIAFDGAVSAEVLSASRLLSAGDSDDDEIVREGNRPADDVVKIEQLRSKLLALEPRRFELFIKDLLVHCGFADVCVTKYSADGGVDVNARAGQRMWLLSNTMFQVQAKRWLHSVGRKEVAELRGSLQPFARGAVVTTSHFSRAAINEASEAGKNPIVLIDGFRLSKVVIEESFGLVD